MAKRPDLNLFSDDELLDLSHEIMDLLMTRQRLSHRKGLLAFDRGECVSFRGPEGGLINGTIKRVNQKSLSIETEHGIWRIDRSFVVKGKAAKGNSGKVLKLQRSE